MKQSLCTFFILWAGIIIGLSFIATPAKFFTPNISKVIALSVGKTTFTIFNKIENSETYLNAKFTRCY